MLVVIPLVALVLLLSGMGIAKGRVVAGVTPQSSESLIVYNHANNGSKTDLDLIEAYDSELAAVAKDQADQGIGKNNFGPNAYLAASRHIEKGDYTSVLDYTKFDLEHRITYDPYLLAAQIVNYVHVIDPSDKIAKDDVWSKPVGQQANYLSDEFVKDPEYFAECSEKLWKVFSENASWSVVELSDYTSSMYMFYHGRDGVRPDIVVRDSTNKGGHAIVLDFGKAGVLKLRLECGYQPINVDYWPTPDKPPVDDSTPTPDNPVPDNPTPSLEPKDPDAGPNAQISDPEEKADFGGGANTDNDTRETSEPTSPDSYTPPKAPSGGGSSNSGGSSSSPDDSKSGSAIVDHDNGSTGKTSDGQDYTVQAGDGQNHTPLDEVQSGHSSDTVETPVAGDGVNTGDDIDPDSVN